MENKAEVGSSMQFVLPGFNVLPRLEDPFNRAFIDCENVIICLPLIINSI